MNRTLRTSLTRWATVIGCAAVAAVVSLIALPWGWQFARKLVFESWVTALPLRVAVWLGLVCIGYIASRAMPVRWSQLRWAHRYPPLWTVLPLSAALATTLHHLYPGLEYPDFVAGAMGPGVLTELSIFLLSGAFLHSHQGEDALPARSSSGSRSLGVGQGKLADWSAVSTWVEAEGPSREDFLDTKTVAARVARLVAEPSGDRSSSIALVGGWGAGKTTVLKWAEQHWDRPDQERSILCCWISLWGVDDSKLLASHVLARIVRTVEQRIDLGALRGVPDSYLRMLQGTPLSGIEAFLRPDANGDPLDRLGHLGPLLEVASARLVVIIEDADRNKADGFDPGHLERVIARLREVKGVSFVVALDDKKLSVDLLRLCEHIELLPKLDVSHVRRVLYETRRHCETAFSYIKPPGNKEERDRLDLKVSSDGGLLEYARVMSDRDVCDAITELIATPRRLKHVVRRVLRVWTALHGEVDLDDVIAVAVLQQCSSEVLAFMVENVDALRGKADEFRKGPAEARKRWETLAQADANFMAADQLVRVLGFQQLSESAISLAPVPQGVQHDEPSDYFRRILGEELRADEVSDQQVLRDMSSWMSGRSTALIEHLASATDEGRAYVQVVEHFGDAISAESVPRCLEQVFERVVTALESTGRWERQPALVMLWREQHRRGRGAMVTPAKLCDMIRRAMPQSLELVNDLYYFWTATDPRYGVYEPGEREEVRQGVRDAARDSLRTPAAIIRATRGAKEPWALAGLVQPADQEEPPSLLRNPSDWAFLGPLVADALQLAPSTLVRQVAALVGKANDNPAPGEGARNYSLRRDVARAVFGSRVDEVRQFLSEYREDGEYWADNVGRECLAWLSDEPSLQVKGAGEAPAPSATDG